MKCKCREDCKCDFGKCRCDKDFVKAHQYEMFAVGFSILTALFLLLKNRRNFKQKILNHERLKKN